MMNAEVLRYAAFTDNGTGGNPAGVVLDASGLTHAQMLAIARDVGYSETAFVVPEADDELDPGRPRRVRIRYFSPVADVAFCGHATVATAVALAERDGPGPLHLTTQAGPVKVETHRVTPGGALAATLISPPTATTPAPAAVVDQALDALGWERADLDPRYPVHVSAAGNRHLVLGVRSRDTLAALDYDFAALLDLMAHQRWTTTHLFWAENATTFHARNPFPPGGVVEDPATGAAAAAFGGYLGQLRLAPVPGRVTIHQGHDMGVPSRLLVDLVPVSPTMQVTGTASRLHATTIVPEGAEVAS
jgi:PhzF family phenazine biosynthesis protein